MLSRLRSYLPETRIMLSLAIPIIIAQVLQISMGFIDTIMVGRLGEAALAALAIASMVFHYSMMTFAGILTAINPLASEALGDGKDDSKTAEIALQGLWLALIFTLPLSFIFIYSEAILLFLGQSQQIASDASEYLTALVWGMFPAIALMGIRAYFEGLMRPRILMVITLVGVVLNIILNNILIFGRLGLPALGLAGAGWATCGVFWLMFAVACLYMHYNPRITPPWQRLTWRSSILLNIIRIGFPIGLALSFEGGMFAVVTLLMEKFGTAALAAQRIALQSITLIFMVPLSLSLVSTARVANFSGQKNNQGMARAGNIGILLSLSFMALSALFFFLKPLWIVELYINSAEYPQATQHAITFLRIAALFMLFDGLQVAASGALRGLKDTTIPMVITFICYWILGVGSGVLLAFRTPLGGQGLWIGLSIGLFSAALALLWRWRKRLNNLHLN